MVKSKTEVSVVVEQGAYKGTILRNSLTTGEFEYHETYVNVKTESGSVLLKASAAHKITKNTKLGKLLARFGAELKDEILDIDTDDYLQPGMEVMFNVERIENKKGAIFSEIQIDTLVPFKG